MTMLEKVKLMLGLENKSHRDSVIENIILNVESRLKVMINKPDDLLPEGLNFVIEEIVIIRYNRIGGEGIAQHSIEGHSITYGTDDFAAYMSIINKFITNDEDIAGKWQDGEVMAF